MRRLLCSLAAAVLLAAGCSSGDGSDSGDDDRGPVADVVLTADDATVAATVDDRFQSYNIEMVEVTGGTFWAPYGSDTPQAEHPPIDLTSARLRNLARALGPAYLRVSGTAANSTYFDADGSAGGAPPEGYDTVLTAPRWDDVGDFADDVGAEVVTSFASSAGARDPADRWRPDNARDLLAYSRDTGHPLVAAEFINEPSLNIGTAPGYDAEGFGRDFEVFAATARETLPSMQLVGPGAVDDETPLLGRAPPIAAVDMLDEVSPAFDAFSYHFYPKVSERCDSEEGPEVALGDEFLSRVEADAGFYEDLRDTYEPGAPMWVTETAQAACGGDRWASQYVDVFRYLDVLGRLALRGTDVVMHNTLAASDYGLLDGETLEPRPNYWAAVLWQRLMGPQALALPAVPEVADVSIYAHCSPGSGGSVSFLILNRSEADTTEIAVGDGTGDLYLLTADDLLSDDVVLNGERPTVAEDGAVPELAPEAIDGPITMPPASVAFVVVAEAALEACGAD